MLLAPECFYAVSGKVYKKRLFYSMNNTGIGQQLRAAREAQNLSLEEISKATHIRVHYLQALEAGDFDSIPSQTQARGFLRALADYLKLDPDPMLAKMSGETAPPAQGAAPGESTGDVKAAATAIETQPTKPTAAKPEPTEVEINPEPAGEKSVQKDTVAEEIPAYALIYKGIGDQLQTRRELLGLTLDDVERHTRLRQHYLVALEAGDIDSLPSPVQGRGMLNNYAVFLGMDPEPVLLRYAEGLQMGLAMRQGRPSPYAETGGLSNESKRLQAQSSSRLRAQSPSQLRRFLSGDLLFGSIFVIALLVFAVWGTLRILNLRSDNSVLPTPPSIAEILLATETPLESLADNQTPTPTRPSAAEDISGGIPIEGEGEQTPVPTLSGGGVQIYLTIYQRALLRVTADGEQVFLARVSPGSAYTFEGSEQVEVLTSNGAAVQVFFNGADQGILGLQGQVVFRIYTPQGVVLPTPTITPTPAPTDIPTATMTPTRTVSPDLPTPPTVPALP